MVDLHAFSKLMHQAYTNDNNLKAVALISSLAISFEITYQYHHWQVSACLIVGLLTHFIIYGYFIPFSILYLFPVLRKLIQLWFLLISTFSDKVLRPSTTRLCHVLPLMWTLGSDDNIWPIECICFTIKLGILGIAMYFSLQIYSYLFFGITCSLYITITVTIVVLKTLWCFLNSINRNLYLFMFIIINIQYFVIPINSFLYIPVILLLTALLVPFLTSHFVNELINNIQLMNFRTYFEFDDNYKQFSGEIINLFITIYLIYRIFLICFINNHSWIVLISIVSILSIYLYTNLIHLISILPSLIMFIFSSIVFSEYIDLSNKYVLVIILIFYFIVIYPVFYLLMRYLTIKLSNKVGFKLKFIREKIREKSLPSFYGYNSSKRSRLYSSNTIYQLIRLFIYISLQISRVLRK